MMLLKFTKFKIKNFEKTMLTTGLMLHRLKLKKLFPHFKFKKTPKFASKEIYNILKKNRVSKNFYNNKKFTRLSYLKKNCLIFFVCNAISF